MRPKDLTQHNCLQYNIANASYGFDYCIDGVQQNIEVSGNLSTNNADALKDAAIQGFGISLSPTFILGDSIKKGELQEVSTDLNRSFLIYLQ